MTDVGYMSSPNLEIQAGLAKIDTFQRLWLETEEDHVLVRHFLMIVKLPLMPMDEAWPKPNTLQFYFVRLFVVSSIVSFVLWNPAFHEDKCAILGIGQLSILTNARNTSVVRIIRA